MIPAYDMTGWLGYAAEREAWAEARACNTFFDEIGLGEEFRLYSEFNEFPKQRLRELQSGTRDGHLHGISNAGCTSRSCCPTT